MPKGCGLGAEETAPRISGESCGLPGIDEQRPSHGNGCARSGPAAVKIRDVSSNSTSTPAAPAAPGWRLPGTTPPPPGVDCTRACPRPEVASTTPRRSAESGRWRREVEGIDRHYRKQALVASLQLMNPYPRSSPHSDPQLRPIAVPLGPTRRQPLPRSGREYVANKPEAIWRALLQALRPQPETPRSSPRCTGRQPAAGDGDPAFGRVLEVGSGPGWVTRSLALLGYTSMRSSPRAT